MLIITSYNTEYFGEDMDELMKRLGEVNVKMKQYRDDFTYTHCIWGNELGWYLTVNIYRKRNFPPIVLN